MERAQRENSRRVAVLTGLTCAALLAMMCTLGWLAIQTKGPTMDEPLHALGGFLHVHYRDWRINPEDPPLWNYWFTLPHARNALRLNPTDPDWVESLANTDYQFRFVVRTLFQTPGNDGVGFIQRSRFMMLLVPVLMLGPLVAWWGWKLGGPIAAVGATLMLALDPNFLAHGALVKNDVPISFVMLALALSTWLVGRKLTWRNALLPGVACGVGMSVKFSGVLLPPMLLAMLCARALFVRDPWPCSGRTVRRASTRLLVALAISLLAGIVCVIIVWASYGFRFDATPQPHSRLPMPAEVMQTARWHYFLDHDGQFPTDEQLAHLPPRPVVRLIVWAEEHRLLPQPWLYGFLFTYRSTLARGTFLLGEYSDTGWWYYFPLAMLFKTPLATLGAFAVTLLVFVIAFRARMKAHGSAVGFAVDRWSALCLTLPLLIYGTSALTTNLNLGLRHVLPLYPFLFLLTAVALARLAHGSRAVVRPLAVVLSLALAVETLVNFPNFIPFFNAPFKPHRLKLLSDSNLDWGQDLPALALWQQRNPASGPLHLCYFGTTDPHVYGIDYVQLPGGFWMGPPHEWVSGRGTSGVLAISATPLQGVNVPPSLRGYYAPLRDVRPLAVLGGSIYVYPLPLPPGIELKRPDLR